MFRKKDDYKRREEHLGLPDLMVNDKKLRRLAKPKISKKISLTSK